MSSKFKAYDRIRDPCLVVSPLSNMPEPVLVFFTFFVYIVEKFHSRVGSEVVIRLTFVFFRFSLREYHSRLGDTSFNCLTCAIVEHYFIVIRSFKILKNFICTTLQSVLDSDSDACFCFRRLQSFSIKNALPSFLYELMHTRTREEAIELAQWFYDNVALKERQKKINAVVKGKFAFVFVSAKHLEMIRMYQTYNFVRNVIAEEHVQRIHVLATGRNIYLARRFEDIMVKVLKLKKVFEKPSSVIGEKFPSKGLSITFEVTDSN